MTHLEEYNRIIESRKANPLPEDQYGENHHIKPKSIYPELVDDKDNIVRLSAQEHFLAHYHLWKAYKDELCDKVNAKKMCYAFIFMKRQLSQCDNIIELAKLYEKGRITLSTLRKGKKRSIETCKKISVAKKGTHLSNKHRQRISEGLKGRQAWNKGKKCKPLSEEHKHRLISSWKGKHHTVEAKRKISEAHKGKTPWNKGKKFK